MQAFTCEGFILSKVPEFLALDRLLAPICEGVPFK